MAERNHHTRYYAPNYYDDYRYHNDARSWDEDGNREQVNDPRLAERNHHTRYYAPNYYDDHRHHNDARSWGEEGGNVVTSPQVVYQDPNYDYDESEASYYELDDEERRYADAHHFVRSPVLEHDDYSETSSFRDKARRANYDLFGAESDMETD